jgi:hypothetical protein
MKLVYDYDGKTEVREGDLVTLRDGEHVRVTYFRPPHKPSSSGKVCVEPAHGPAGYSTEYYVGVIGATWIDREDRA